MIEITAIPSAILVLVFDRSAALACRSAAAEARSAATRRAFRRLGSGTRDFDLFSLGDCT